MGRRYRFAVCVAVLLAAVPASARASDEASRAEISAALMQWTADFNAGRADRVCELFARELRADFRGQPERGYDAQCELLKRSLADSARRYSYTLAVREISGMGRRRRCAADLDADHPAQQRRSRDHLDRTGP
jgi:hypothetical protein